MNPSLLALIVAFAVLSVCFIAPTTSSQLQSPQSLSCLLQSENCDCVQLSNSPNLFSCSKSSSPTSKNSGNNNNNDNLISSSASNNNNNRKASILSSAANNCSNLGVPSITDATSCSCPLPQWQGQTCLKRECVFDGISSPSNPLPNNVTNACQCQDPEHNEGISCQLCKNGGGCQQDSFCDDTILSIGPNSLESNMECVVADDSFNALLGGVGVATYNCQLPNQTSGNNDGSCAVSFFRKNSGASPPVTFDNYFHCNLNLCSARQEIVTDESPNAKVSNATRHLFAFARFVILALMFTFVAIRFVSAIPKRTKLVAAFSALTIIMMGLLMLMIWLVSTAYPENSSQSMVIYDCGSSVCSCYEDSGRAGPNNGNCFDSMFGQKILPVLTSGATLKCLMGGSGMDERSCTFVQKDLNSEVLLKCKGSVCRSKNSGASSSSNAMNTSQANSTSGSNKDDSFKFGDVLKQKLTSTVAIIVGGVLFLSAIIFWWSRTRKETERMSQEFKVRFLTQRVAVRGGDDEQNSDNHNNNNNNRNADDNNNNSPNTSEIIEHDIFVTPKKPNNNNTRHVVDSFTDVDEADESTTSSHPNNRNPTGRTTTRRQSSSSSSSSLPELFSLSTTNLSYTVQNTTSSNSTTNFSSGQRAQTSSNVAVLATTPVLRNVTIHLPGGHLIGILGASGSSKTSLLDALSGTLDIQGAMTGRVQADHRDIFPNQLHDGGIAKEFQAYCAVSSFVAQQDILLPSLTVRESVYYSARLKLPALLETVEIMEIVGIVLQLLRLEECADRLIGGGTSDIRGLSGGERRRVSIATELVGLPRFLLADEPTSGLSSTDAFHVVECLSDIAQGRSSLFNHPALGKFAHYRPLVVFSLHQPSEKIYALLDSVILMNKGRAVFCGPSVSAIPFLLENVRRELMADSHDMTVPERLLNISEFADFELDNAAAATSKAMTSAIAASRLNSIHAENSQFSSYNSRESMSSALFSPTSNNNNNNSWLHDEEAGSQSGNRNQNNNNQESENSENFTHISISRVQIAANNRIRYAQSWVAQIGYLILRGWRCSITTYNILFSHALATVFIGSALALLYKAQPLTLAGALDRAGSMTYMLLVTAFLSLSSIDWIVTERRLLHFERRNHCYGTFGYFVSKFFVDFLPFRIVPSAALSILVYGPMGLRTDGGSYFAWFALVNGLFAVQTSAMTMCAAALTSTFGAAALLASIVILWNFVFCGLLIQAGTLPLFFVPFRDISPFFLAFEALLVNELDNQNCMFAPVDASGRPSSHQIPLYCKQYLFNLGLKPDNFVRDVLTLFMWCGVFVVLAGLCLHGIPEFVRVFAVRGWNKVSGFVCCCFRKESHGFSEMRNVDTSNNNNNTENVERNSLVTSAQDTD